MLKPLLKTMALVAAVWSTPSLAQFPQLDIRTTDASLKQYTRQMNQDGWFAYSIPAADGTASMCCFNKGEQAACDLNEKQYGYGSSSHSPDTDNIHVFVHVKDGSVNRLMPVGDHCTVQADGITVDWLTSVTSGDSIKWLQQEVTSNGKGDESGSLYVLSLHAEKQAAEALYDLAKDNDRGYSEQSIFWLGQRDHDGFDYLKTLYDELPVGQLRRKLNFALSQNDSNEAVELLKDIAQHDQDDEQQAEAIFWLSQTDEVADLPAFLVDMLNRTERNSIKEKAIFSLSQIDNEEANQELANLVNDHDDAHVREKALFWLSQNSPEQARQAALELLQTGHDVNEQENAVFVLSQLPAEQSSSALLKIIKGNYARSVKKKALFWLTQSDDEETLQQLEDLL